MTRKRAAGEGTIRQLKSGHWSWVRMVGRDAEGKPVYERVTADTQRELLKAIEEHKQQKVAAAEKNSVPIFKDFAEAWFGQYKGNVRISTQCSYQYTLQKLQMYWGETPLDQVRASGVSDMLKYFREMRLSNSYIKKLKSMMSQIMEAAEGDGIVNRNPCRYVKKIKEDAVCLKKDAFTKEEIRRLILAEQSKQRDFAVLACATGMRTQELLALQGKDIAEGGVRISISKAVNMDGNIPLIGQTKSEDSKRVVPVPSYVQNIADRYRVYGDGLFGRVLRNLTVQSIRLHIAPHLSAFVKLPAFVL